MFQFIYVQERGILTGECYVILLGWRTAAEHLLAVVSARAGWLTHVQTPGNFVTVMFPAMYYVKTVYICYLPAGRSVLGKTVPEVLSTARGRRPRAVLKTKGTVFPNTDQPRPANNVFIFFSLENYFIRNIFVKFLLQQFHTVRVRSSKPVLFTEVFKRRDSVFADFKLTEH